MVKKHVIFFPQTLLETNGINIKLLGFTEFMKNVQYYFILPNYVNENTECKFQTIGHFTKTKCQSCFKQNVMNFLCITEINGNLNASLFPGHLDNFVLIIYDPSRLHNYGMSLECDNDSQKFICFTMLSKWLSSTEYKQKYDRVSGFLMAQRFSKCLLFILNILINSFETKFVQLTILRLTLFKHLLGVMKNFVWLIENLIYNRFILSRQKAINYLISYICDALFGIAILYLVNTTFTSSNELFSYISSISHVNKFIIYI